MKKLILILSIVLLSIDQVIKVFITKSMDVYSSIKLIPNFLNLTYVKNTGAAFSILQGGRIFFIILGIISLIVLIRFILLDKKITKFDSISYSLVLAGISGNLIDRIFYGGVIDYISINLPFYDMPIFNLADMCIVIGILMIIYIMIIKGDSDENIYRR
ncbi:MAG: signal peptidase II [Bacilli bacterium]|nr:signal peptidase II [Bacilli bacterium]